MRTREEQISALAFEIDGVQAKEATKRLLERNLIEAERRAEQRVRAEIGRDSERLDWLENTRSVVLEDANNGWRVTIAGIEFSLMEETARNAIDAAREAG
ncbi:hypothetical protein [Acetobacter indonesiensis]|uniref:hypothetical protein n=1 Tax=Acetobacter indonesiensis TaxID=104101 RepID=UPI0020A5BDA6|nr:hypothetical protein [Acetobacter indonesiensis]MCP1230842.1 hypothetical protein [Acetobacter indonesiensis]